MIGTVPRELLVECPRCQGSGEGSGAVGSTCVHCTGTGRVGRESATFQNSLIGRAALVVWYGWMLFLAAFRLSDDAVCAMSRGLPPGEDFHAGEDFHDYPDSVTGESWHMHTCRRCGKEFTI